MKDSRFAVHKQVVIVRQYKDVGITSKLQAYHIPTAEALPARYYNGRIAYQYKGLRVGLTSLRKQPRCRVLLTVHIPPLPF